MENNNTFCKYKDLPYEMNNTYFEGRLNTYKKDANEMREDFIKEFFDYKNFDYATIELQSNNMNNFRLKEKLLHKIVYANRVGSHYYFKGEFIMSEENGVFYLGEWYGKL